MEKYGIIETRHFYGPREESGPYAEWRGWQVLYDQDWNPCLFDGERLYDDDGEY